LAAAHPAQLKRGEFATEWEKLEKAHKKDVLNALRNTRDATNPHGITSVNNW